MKGNGRYKNDMIYLYIMSFIHVVHNGNQWQVKQENARRSSGNFRTQQEAFESARVIATNN